MAWASEDTAAEVGGEARAARPLTKGWTSQIRGVHPFVVGENGNVVGGQGAPPSPSTTTTPRTSSAARSSSTTRAAHRSARARSSSTRRSSGSSSSAKESSAKEAAAITPQGCAAETGAAVAERTATQVQEAVGYITTFVLVVAGIALLVGSFALLGASPGIVLGVAIQHSLVDDGVTEIAIPWVQIVVFLVHSAVVGLLAAAWPAWRASRMEVLRVIATE